MLEKYKAARERRKRIRVLAKSLREFNRKYGPESRTLKVTVPVFIWFPYLALWGIVLYLLIRSF